MDGRFVAYYRVSTDKQKRSGLGLDAQQTTVRGFLNGGQWELVGEFTETESGRSADRPELAKALARCRVTKATLIVAHEVTNVGNHRTQLLAMGRQARAVMACEELTVLADRGYYNDDEVLACEGSGVLPYVPKTQTSGNTSRVSSRGRTSSTTPNMTATPARRASP